MKKSLTNNPDLFSDSAWTLLLESENEAQRWRHKYLDVEHLLQVLFGDQNYLSFVEGLPINHSYLLDGVEGFLANLPVTNVEQLFIGEDLEQLLDTAESFRSSWGSRVIEISHILIALGRDKRIGNQLFADSGLPSELLEGELKRLTKPISLKRKNPEESITLKKSTANLVKPSPRVLSNKAKRVSIEANESHPSEAPSIKSKDIERNPLQEFGRDLTEAAMKGELDPVIGRDEEIKLVLKVLSRRGKNNPVLIGAPGVGKTAIAELLAQRIISNEVPDSLIGLKLISLDIGALIAGTKFRGQFEERLRSVLSKASDPEEGVILFLDELHTILSTDRSSADAGSLLKPVLASGELRCIGASTPENFQRTIGKDQALSRRFQKVPIKEPSVELSVEILRGIKERYELHHEVKITDQALITANRLADRYISDRCLPDKAIDLIDEAAAQLKMEANSRPKVLEEAELNIKELNIRLNEEEEKLSDGEAKEIQSKLDLLLNKYENLSVQWEEEKIKIKELKELIKKENILHNSIAEAEDLGDLETVARLKYDELHYLDKRVTNIETFLAKLRKSGNALLRAEVEPEDIADVVARWTGIPINKVMAGEKQKLLTLEIELADKVVGQLEAVKAVAEAIRRARAGMKDSHRPIGSFLFLGPTGVGKTELAKALATSLFDEEEALIRLDMSEFMERNAVARMLGAPPGYVGYEEGGQLTEAVRRRPYSVLLFDEIEKGHPDVFNILLQVLDDGRLTDSQGRTVDFRHTVIVMTSNLASRRILRAATELSSEPNHTIELNKSLSKDIDQALREQFRPEFLNRIDEIIRFSPLSISDLERIVRLQLRELTELLAEQDLELRIDDSTIETLAKEGYEPEYGARPLRRILRRRIENPLATKLLEDAFIGSNAVKIKTAKDNSSLLEFIGEN